MQKMTLSFGVTLEDKKTVEWKQVATMFLKDWKSQKGIVNQCYGQIISNGRYL